jgi:hypothetical protein
MMSEFALERHKLKCPLFHPPDNEIYRDGNVSVFEVDGRKHKVIIIYLDLLPKLVSDCKNVFGPQNALL